MPVVAVPDDPGLRSVTGAAPEPATDISGLPGAAFRQANTVVSTLSAIANSGTFAPDPTHNPLDVIKGTNYFNNHADRFIASNSEAQTRHTMRTIDAEEADRRTLEAAGGLGTIASMLAGTLDPTIALPAGAAVRAVEGGYSAARSALSVGRAALAQSASQEAILQASQETRPLGESALNVASSTILGAFLGAGAAGLLTRAERQVMTKGIDDARAEMNAHAGNEGVIDALSHPPPEGESGRSLATAVGAAASDTRRLDLVPTGLEKVPGVGTVIEHMNPQSRVFHSDSVQARRTVADLAEFPGLFKENLEGIPTTAGPPLDRSARMAITQTTVQTSDELSRLFGEYRFGNPDTTYPRARAQFQRITGQDEGKMTFAEFKQEVSRALSEGDQHAIPQVEQAARMIREKVFEPWKERAIKAGLLDEDVAAKGADSYFQRIYNKQAIGARRDAFVNKVQDWLKSDQQTKAESKDKLSGFARQLDMAEKRIADLEASAAKLPENTKARADIEYDARLAASTRDQIRANIEAELKAWEGKSASAAKSAMKRRDAEARSPDLARLRAADPEIDAAVRRIIESDRDLSDAELRGRAHEITDRILSSPDGRLPYDIHMGGPEVGWKGEGGEVPRGALARRDFAIPDATIRDFLEQDVEQVVRTHLRTMVPDVLLTERFGDTRMTEAFRKINDEYAALSDAAPSNAARTKLEKQRQKVIDDVAAMRDRIRSTYGFSSELPLRNAARIVGAVKSYNVLTSMGVAAISSLPDIAGAVFRHGLTTTFADSFMPFLRGLMKMDDGAWKEAKSQFRAMGIATEVASSSRHHALDDTLDLYRPQSRVERTLQYGAEKFQLLNGLAQWTDFAKTTAALTAGSELLRASQAIAEGKATQRQLRMLGENNIDAATATRIHEAFTTGGEVRNGVLLPNTADWKDTTARTAFEGAVSREADIAVVTPGQDKPLILSQPILSVFGQFKTFTAASTQRMLVANLQRRDAQVLQGLFFSLALGMMSYKVNSMLGGQPTSDKPQDWIKEAISRGNLLGWFEEGNALASKATGGGVDIYRLIGAEKPLSRYASRSALDQLLGPTSGKIDSLLKVTRGAAKGEWNESDTKAVRRLIAGQNLYWLRGALNQVEAGANNAFGIEMKVKPNEH